MLWAMIAVAGISFIASLVFWIMVLVKLLKEKGAMHLIIGIFIGLYPFVWGWIKHKEQKLTKVMLGWTITSLLPIVLSLVIPMMAVGLVQDTVQEQAAPNAAQARAKAKAARAKAKAEKARKANAAAKAAKKAETSASAFQNAVGLWNKGAYQDAKAAAAHLDAFIRKNPKAAAGYNNRGVARLELGDSRQALRDFNQALTLSERYPEAYNNRGNTYFAMKEYEKALADYEQVVRLAPEKAFGYLNKGLVLLRLEKKQEACSALEEACRKGDCDGVKWARTQNLCPAPATQ